MSKKEFTSIAFNNSPFVDYIAEEDKYMFKRTAPTYKFNVIGVGMMGLEHVKCTLMEGRADIHGIYDECQNSIDMAVPIINKLRRGKEVTVYESLEEACSDEGIDGIIIATPNYTHIDVLRVAIKYNKHILLEKPMATDLLEAYEMLEMAKTYQSVLQVGLQYRYKANYVEAIHEAKERQSIGDIKNMFIMEHRIPFLDKVKQWNKFSKYSGGTLVEKCCHYFDLFNLFADSRPKSVYAVGSMAVNFLEFERNGEKSDIIDNGSVIVKYENGIVGNFSLCMFAPMFYEELVLTGDKGRLKTSHSENFSDNQDSKVHFEVTHNEIGLPVRISKPAYHNGIGTSGHNGSTFYEHKYFVDRIEGDKTNTATVEEGFWAVVVGIAAEQSIKKEREINIHDMLREAGVDI